MPAESRTLTLDSPSQRRTTLLDLAFTARTAKVEVRGIYDRRPQIDDKEVSACVDLSIDDESESELDSQVFVAWQIRRSVGPVRDGRFRSEGFSVAVDEIEPLAAALSKAVSMAKERGYLP